MEDEMTKQQRIYRAAIRWGVMPALFIIGAARTCSARS
jgi:hypothetical protein